MTNTQKPDVPGFEVLSELGRGSEGVVHLVRRTWEDPARVTRTAEYALKTGAAGHLPTFRRQAALLAAVDHPDLPVIHETGEIDGGPYLVMDVVHGSSLSSRLTAGPLPVAEVVRLAMDLVGPLDALHRRGFVHRDLKPSNVLIEPGGRARLIDFGLAAGQEATQGQDVVGTLAYASPEQAGVLRRPVDGRSDLYALGAVLYECLAGKPPFATDDLGEMLRMHATTPPPPLDAVAPLAPAALVRMIAKLLAKDPDDRYDSAAALGGELVELSAQLGIPGTIRWPDDRSVQTPLVGRGRDLATLTTRWLAAAAGRPGVTLIRSAGPIGRTRLLQQFASDLADTGVLVLQGRGTPDAELPLAWLRAAVEEMLQRFDLLPEPERSAALDRVRTAAKPGGSLLAPLSPRLARFLQLDPGAENDEAAGTAHFTAAVSDLLAGLARAWPGLLLCLDDLPLLDSATLQVLTHLYDDSRQDALPILAVLTARDDDDAAIGELAEAAGSALDTGITLQPVGAEAITRLVQWYLPQVGIADRLGTLLADSSGGSPGLAWECLRSICEAGLLHPRWGAWQLDEAGLRDLDLPADAVALVLTRLSRLTPGAREVLQVGAAIGSSFTTADATAACPGTSDPTSATVEAAELRLLVAGSGDTYAFVSEQVRTTLLDELDGRARETVHQRIALALTPIGPDGGLPAGGSVDEAAGNASVRLLAAASHFLHGQPRSTPAQAIGTLHAAGLVALAGHAAPEAAGYLRAALELQDELLDGGVAADAEARVVVALGTALQRAGRYTEASAVLKRALVTQGDPLQRGRINSMLADVLRATWDTAAAREAVHAGLAELGVKLPRSTPGALLRGLGRFLIALVILRTGRGRGSASGRDAERLHLISSLHYIGGYVGQLGLRPVEVAIHSLFSLRPAVRIGHGFEFVRAVSGCSVAAAYFGLGRLSRWLGEQARREAVRLGDPRAVAVNAWYDGVSTYFSGADDGERWLAAVDRHHPYLDTGQVSDAVASTVWDACVEGRLASVLPAYQLAQRRVSSEAGQEITSMLTLEGAVLAVQGRAAEAGANLVSVQAALSGRDEPGVEVNRSGTLVLALLEQQDFGERFDQAVAEYHAVSLGPRLMIRPHRGVYQHQVFGLLTRARQQAADQQRVRPQQLREIRSALRLFKAAAQTPAMRAAYCVASADLRELEGRPQAALKMLDQLKPSPRFLPVVAFEAARVRARALLALACPDEARLQVRMALALAAEQGWPHRTRWVTAEFGIDHHQSMPSTLGRGANPPSRQSGGSGGERLRLQALEAMSRAAARVLDPDELARVALDESLRILAAERAFIFFTDDGLSYTGGPDGTGPASTRDVEDSTPLTMRIGRDASGRELLEPTGYSASLVDRVRRTREPLVVTGTEQGAALGAASVVLHDLRSILIAPIELDGRLLGVVYLDSRVAKGIFSADDVGILAALTNHVATALATARSAQLELSVRTAHKQRDLAEQLRLALDDMTRADGPEEVLARLLTHSRTLLAAADACVLEIRPAGLVALREVAAGGEISDPRVLQVAPLPDQPGLRAVMEAPEPAWGHDLPPGLSGVVRPAPGWLSVPLPTRGGNLRLVVTTEEAAHGETRLEVAATLAAQAAAAYENATLLAQLRSQAVTDELTGIANRRRFFDLIADPDRAHPDAAPRTVAMVDIDHFKRINDRYGHPTGDDVIREVAARLAAAIREGDLVARYGGEEFVLVLHGLAAPGALLERLRSAVGGVPIPTRSGPLEVTVSLGATEITGEQPDMREGLARADTALYRAKQAGRDRVETI